MAAYTMLCFACRSSRPTVRACRALQVALVVWLAAGAAGCVSRRMTIRSNPPGALVYIDDYEIGTTPVSTDFVYYGTRKIRLVKDGYETLTVYQKISPPWYQWLGIDFVAENVYPGEIRDERTFDLQLAPERLIPGSVVRQRAEELRQGSRAAAAVPLNTMPLRPAPTLPSPAPEALPDPVSNDPGAVPLPGTGASGGP